MTGRSPSSPAMQNIPLPKTEEGQRIVKSLRDAFWPNPQVFTDFDYTTLERWIVERAHKDAP